MGRGPPRHLAAAIPTLPALAGGEHTHPPHAAGCAGRAGLTGTPRAGPHTRAPRPGPGRAGLARLRGDSGGGGWDC